MNITFQIGIEGISDELLAFYAVSGMERGLGGGETVTWTFASNPTPFCVARSQEDIVGLSAYVSTNMRFGNDIGIGLQAIDSFVSGKMRGQGLFTKLALAYAQHAAVIGADIVWGFPNDNAAPAWYQKLNWINHGQVPFLIRPLRARYFLRKLGLPGDFSVFRGVDLNLNPLNAIGPWADELWYQFSRSIGCSTVRNRAYLDHRLYRGPKKYRVVADSSDDGALVASCMTKKHGGSVAYLMEAMGRKEKLIPLIRSELAHLHDQGAEVVLAWCFPWSPNYPALRKCGFIPLPEKLRPIRIWFGGKALSERGVGGEERRGWYLSYLDSDTV